MTHQHKHDASTRLGTAFVLNLAFTLVELVGGYLTNSVAIATDALHDLGDSLSLGMAWYLDRYSRRKRDTTYTFGYLRFSLLGALITSIVLVVGSVLILIEAVPRIIEPQPARADGMFLLAILGIAVNGAAALRMRKGHSLNERVVTWHLMEDVLGWVAVLIVSIVMFFYDIPVLDPILSILITVYILSRVIVNLRETMTLFLQGVPADIDLHSLTSAIKEIEGVNDVHRLHVWSQDGEHHVMSAHIVTREGLTHLDSDQLRKVVKDMVTKYGIFDTTIEVEVGKGHCTD